MNGLGNQFFSGAAFAADEDRGAGRRHLGDQVEQREHFFALADDVGEIETLLQGALELNVFVAQPPRFDRLRDLRQEFVVRPGLGDVIHGAAFEGGSRHLDRAIRGDQHDGKMRILPVNVLEHFDAIAVRQADVQQHQVKRALFQPR